MHLRIAVTGGSGFIGRKLTESLLRDQHQNHDQHQIVILTRNAEGKPNRDNVTYVEWLTDKAQPESHLEGMDAFINLAGESINRRWSPKQKEKILNSRVEATREIIRILGNLQNKPQIFLSASATEAMRQPKSAISLTELKGMDFLTYVVHRWEEEANKAAALGVKTGILRFGIVLGLQGGALPGIIRPYQFFAGGKVGSGKQWTSWIHIDDAVDMIQFAMRNGLEGPLEIVSPNPVTMDELGRTVASVMKRPHWLPVPELLLKAALGEISSLILEGHRVLPEKALQLGYPFRHPDLQGALRNLLASKTGHSLNH